MLIQNGKSMMRQVKQECVRQRDADKLKDAELELERLDTLRATWRRIARGYGIKVTGDN
jgi:hypothetical protein